MPHIHAPEIQRICNERGITALMHFTHIQNLQSILQKGLLSRYVLEQLPIEQQPAFNDSERLDRCKQAVCLSLSFPNYKMFYKYSHSSPSDWVVLMLKASILWELDCVFCCENAASNKVSRLPIEARRQAHSLLQMFFDHENVQRQNSQIPNNYPTHPQAEVLVLEPISSRYISAVHFYNELVANQWITLNNEAIKPYLLNLNSQFFCYSQQYFKPRQDWGVWQSVFSNAANPQADTSNLSEIPF